MTGKSDRDSPPPLNHFVVYEQFQNGGTGLSPFGVQAYHGRSDARHGRSYLRRNIEVSMNKPEQGCHHGHWGSQFSKRIKTQENRSAAQAAPRCSFDQIRID